MPREDETATARVPLTPTTFGELRDFRSGLGRTFDDAIFLLLALAKNEGETAFEAGRRLINYLNKDKE